MKRIFLALALFAVPAAAQKWDAAGEQTIEYPLKAGDPEVIGNGDGKHGGTAPAANFAGYIASNFDTSAWQYDAAVPTDVYDGHDEPKFRTHCQPGKAGWFDPILYPGQANAGHPHLFFGNTGITKDSTYATLRASGGSTCGGGILNRSGYWVPGLMYGDTPNTNTANKMLKNDFSTVYYNGGDVVTTKKSVPFAPGFGMVNGFDVNDPTMARYKAIIDRNNARPGATASYAMPYQGQKWKCEDGSVQSANAPRPNQADQPYFRKKDGSWAMECGKNTPGLRLVGEVVMQDCWDGKNVSSPDARRHVIPSVREVNSAKFYCPNGWYRLANFEQTILWTVSNAEIASGRLYLASDRMAANSANWFNDGETLHMDFLPAWDPPTMLGWMSQCLGMDDLPGQPAIGTPRGAVNTNFCTGKAGIVAQAAPDGSRSPQIDFNVRQNLRGVYRYYPVVKPIGPVAGAHTHGM